MIRPALHLILPLEDVLHRLTVSRKENKSTSACSTTCYCMYSDISIKSARSASLAFSQRWENLSSLAFHSSVKKTLRSALIPSRTFYAVETLELRAEPGKCCRLCRCNSAADIGMSFRCKQFESCLIILIDRPAWNQPLVLVVQPCSHSVPAT